MRLLPVTLLLAVVPVAVLLPAGMAAADDVKIYRCVAADGSIAVRDSACPEGETQQVRNMTRPQDPPAPAPGTQPAQPHSQYYSPPSSAYDGVSSGGGVVIRRPVYPVPVPAPAQPADWGHGSWIKGSWTDSGSWTDR